MAKIVDLDHKWAHEIGRAFIAFGSLESSVNHLIHTVPADPIHKSTSPQLLSQKLTLLIEILTARTNKEEKVLLKLLRNVQKLSDSRNRYLAIGVVCVLDKYIDDCATVSGDDGEPTGDQGEYQSTTKAPAAPIYPSDVDWHSIKYELMYAIRSLPSVLRSGLPFKQHQGSSGNT